MKQTRFCLLFLLVVVVILPGQDITVEYLEGFAEAVGPEGRRDIFIGDTLSADATIILEEGTILELRLPGRSLVLSRSGRIEMATILTAGENAAASGFGRAVRNRIQSAVTDRSERSRDAIAAGVRSSDAAQQPSTIWAGGESTRELIDQGIEILNDGAPDEAYLFFRDAMDFADGSEAVEARLLAAYSAYLNDQRANALVLLRSSIPHLESPWYQDHMLLLAQLLADSFDYDEAIRILETFLKSPGSDTAAMQTAYLLKGQTLAVSGDLPSALEALQQAVASDPDSETARTARTFIQTLSDSM